MARIGVGAAQRQKMPLWVRIAAGLVISLLIAAAIGIAGSVAWLKDAMREACERKGRIVLDLKEVPMMDSSGLGAVVTLHVSARTRGCRLEVVNASTQILELFSVMNVLSLFEATGRCGGRLM